MTVVLGVSSYTDGFMISDCRVTFSGLSKQHRYRDFCQKLFASNWWSIVGIAGDLRLVRDLALGVLTRLGETEWFDQDWLRSDDALVEFLRRGHQLHRFDRHRDSDCTCGSAHLLIAWLDYSRRSPDGEGKWISGPPTPDPRLIEVRIQGTECRHRRIRRGAAVIGRRPDFAATINPSEFDEMVTYFGRYRDNPNVGDAHRALLATTELHRQLVAQNMLEGIGGLYQVMTFGPRGVQAVPYFYLADVAPGYRTYVAMRIDKGEWVQEHRPTGRQVRVKRPWDINLDTPPRSDSIFDPALNLKPTSSGVIAAKELETVFVLYDPPTVPEAVQPSWGTDPLPEVS